MKLPLQTQYLIDEYLEIIHRDIQHKLTPQQRLLIYQSFNSEETSYANAAFMRLQIITAYYVLPIWKKAEPNNQLAEDLLQMATQILQKDKAKKDFKEKLQNIWVDLGIAEINSLYTPSVFAAAVAAFEALYIIVNGFDYWEGWKFDQGDTDDDLGMWGNDSAKWASIACAGWVMDINSIFDQKRFEFWEWWLTEAIPTAWDLAFQAS